MHSISNYICCFCSVFDLWSEQYKKPINQSNSLRQSSHSKRKEKKPYVAPSSITQHSLDVRYRSRIQQCEIDGSHKSNRLFCPRLQSLLHSRRRPTAGSRTGFSGSSNIAATRFVILIIYNV